MALASVEDVTARLGRDLSVGEQTQAAYLLQIASALIKTHARQQLEFVSGDVAELTGSSAAMLQLPQRPVVDVTSVQVEGGVWESGRWRRRGDRLIASHWGGPHATVQVTYSHGFQQIPDDLRGVCVEMVARAVEAPTVAVGGSGIVAETIGSYSVRYADPTNFNGDDGPQTVLGLSANELLVVHSYRRRVAG